MGLEKIGFGDERASLREMRGIEEKWRRRGVVEMGREETGKGIERGRKKMVSNVEKRLLIGWERRGMSFSGYGTLD